MSSLFFFWGPSCSFLHLISSLFYVYPSVFFSYFGSHIRSLPKDIVRFLITGVFYCVSTAYSRLPTILGIPFRSAGYRGLASSLNMLKPFVSCTGVPLRSGLFLHTTVRDPLLFPRTLSRKLSSSLLLVDLLNVRPLVSSKRATAFIIDTELSLHAFLNLSPFPSR